MAETLKLEIVTPEAVIYSEDVEMVTLPGQEGEAGIYPNHEPLMTKVQAGELIARNQLAGLYLGHQRLVVRVNACLAFLTGQGHHLHVLGVNDGLRGDDLELESFSHVRLWRSLPSLGSRQCRGIDEIQG